MPWLIKAGIEGMPRTKTAPKSNDLKAFAISVRKGARTHAAIGDNLRTDLTR
jgi:hypothetical protein